MSFLKHQATKTIKPTITLTRTATNQLEILRRAFELDTNQLMSEMLELAIQAEFDRRMADVGALPDVDGSVEDLEPSPMLAALN